MSIITENIDRILKERGMAKKDFYAKLDITAAAYSQWRLEQSQPSITKLYVAADILDVDIADIVSGKKRTAAPEDDGLNDAERNLIELFRLLPEEHQSAIVRRLQELVRLQKAQDDLLRF